MRCRVLGEPGQARVVRVQALEEKDERIVPAPFQFVADSAELLHVAVRKGRRTSTRPNLTLGKTKALNSALLQRISKPSAVEMLIQFTIGWQCILCK